MALFRLLHVSDLHLGGSSERIGMLPFVQSPFRLSGYSGVATVCSHNEAMLEGLALFHWLEGGAFDAVVVTGDLATTGSDEDLSAADNFLCGSPSPGVAYETADDFPTLNSRADLNLFVLPGNHDRYEGSFLAPGGDNFDTVFGPNGNNLWPGGQGAFKLGKLEKEGVALVLVAGDLTLRDTAPVSPVNPGHVWGAGCAYYTVVEEMERLTWQARHDYRDRQAVEVIWLVHFPPQFPRANRCLSLLNEDRLVKGALDARVNYILSGHTHKGARYARTRRPHNPLVRSVTVLCAGTATEHRLPGSKDSRTIHLLEFDISGGAPARVDASTLKWSVNDEYWLP